LAARTPQELHKLFVEAFNARDLDALEAIYETEAKLALEDGTVVEGRPAIREVFKGFLALNATMSLETRQKSSSG
jgi:ketosteroid isomerase-like protein